MEVEHRSSADIDGPMLQNLDGTASNVSYYFYGIKCKLYFMKIMVSG